MNLPKILIIDDQFGRYLDARRDLCAMFGLSDDSGDDSQPELVAESLAKAVFCSGQVASNGFVENNVETALKAASCGWPFSDGSRWALVLLDLRFVSGSLDAAGKTSGRSGDDNFGLKILEGLKKSFPDLPIVILSSHERAGVIEDCRKLGASDFIQRHPAVDGLSPREILASKLHEYGLLEDKRGVIIGRSLSLLKALSFARRAATGKGNVLLLGETGTGKELFARFIHDFSPKHKGPYRVFHSFGTAETLQEDELFGHETGAFTGARSAKQGIFEATNGGTLFIDELGDISEALQNKLLRPIEASQISRQGGDREIPLDIQVILATNKDLDEYTKTGKFKIDLLNRVKAYPITLPPLKDRKEDIPLIADHLIESLCKENNARWPRKVLSETLSILMNYAWPDNIRGLRNVLERAIKNNKDSELLIPSDIRIESYTKSATESNVNIRLQTPKAEEEGDLGSLLEMMSNFRFPKDYQTLHGKLPEIQKAIALLLTNYLLSALEVSKKRRPGTSDGELNITGAASCMIGTQLKTPKAADMIKKLLQTDKNVLKDILEENLILKELYKEVLRLRPSKPNNNSSK